MQCPKCGTIYDIKWFLRHQAKEEEKSEDKSTLANVITILCTKCGFNESYFLDECLEDIFPNWRENAPFDLKSPSNSMKNMSDIDLGTMLGSFLGGNSNMIFDSNISKEKNNE